MAMRVVQPGAEQGVRRRAAWWGFDGDHWEESSDRFADSCDVLCALVRQVWIVGRDRDRAVRRSHGDDLSCMWRDAAGVAYTAI